MYASKYVQEQVQVLSLIRTGYIWMRIWAELQISVNQYPLFTFVEKHELLIHSIWQNMPTAVEVPA